jgi:hypothetical protein
VLASCRHNPLDIDVSHINVPPVKIDRLEKDMFSMPPDSVAQRTPALVKKYGRFYANFVTGFINDGGLMNANYAISVKRFITDSDMHETYDTCEKVYPNMAFLEEGLTDVFKHYKFYFPDSSLPRLLTLMSGFNYALIFYNNTLAISLEMYLGSKSSFYKRVDFPHYKVMHMNRSYLQSDAVYGWLESVFKPNEDKNDMLSQIVHEGKVMYLVDALLPNLDDTIKMRYSAKQLKWCKDNEFNMWAYIIQQKFLYSTSEGEIKKFTDDGPFTTMFNHDFSPARTGNWLGWQIVRTYMKNNPGVTIPQLLAERNADKILARSGYKPSK